MKRNVLDVAESHPAVARHLGAGRGLKPFFATIAGTNKGRSAFRCRARIETLLRLKMSDLWKKSLGI